LGATERAMGEVQVQTEESVTEFVGKLHGLNPITCPYASTNRHLAIIERVDIDTVHENRHVELEVAPQAVDKILDVKGEGKTFEFTVRNAVIIDVKEVASPGKAAHT
jgi:hypothetical protein